MKERHDYRRGCDHKDLDMDVWEHNRRSGWETIVIAAIVIGVSFVFVGAVWAFLSTYSP